MHSNQRRLLISEIVRVLVEQRLQTELTGERRTFMDQQIDTELANM